MQSRVKTEIAVAKKFKFARIAQAADGEVGMGEMILLGQDIQLGQLKFGGQFIDEGLKKPDRHVQIVGAIRGHPTRFNLFDNHFNGDFGRPIQQGYQFVELGYDQG